MTATFPPCFSGLPAVLASPRARPISFSRASNEENAGAAARAQEKQKHDPSLGPVFVGFVKPVVDASPFVGFLGVDVESRVTAPGASCEARFQSWPKGTCRMSQR